MVWANPALNNQGLNPRALNVSRKGPVSQSFGVIGIVKPSFGYRISIEKTLLTQKIKFLNLQYYISFSSDSKIRDKTFSDKHIEQFKIVILNCFASWED